MRRLDGITDSMCMSVSELREMARDRKPGGLQQVGSEESDVAPRLSNITLTGMCLLSQCVLRRPHQASLSQQLPSSPPFGADSMGLPASLFSCFLPVSCLLPMN